MKNNLIYIALIICFCFTGCSKAQLDEINTDTTKIPEKDYDPNELLSTAQLKYANIGYYQLVYQSTMMQLLASTYFYYNNGDKYINVANFTDYQGRIFEEGYLQLSVIREMQRLANLKNQETNSNLINIGDIMAILILQRITDTYGDVPYFDAAKAMQGIKYPRYDKQEDIYDAMLTDLEKAIQNLDPQKPKPTADLFYKGDILKWKKLGYAILLRMAMRLIKVNPEKAKMWAEKCAGNTFTDISDNAIIVTDASSFNSQNGTSLALRTFSDYREVRWSKTLIDQLRKTNDPRLGVIGEVPQPGLANNADQKLSGNSDPSVQLGLPNGLDLQEGPTDVRNSTGYPGGTGTGADFAPLGKYSRPKTALYLKLGGPIFIMTYAETELLLAEAKARGWNIPGAATTHYANGVTAALQSLAQLDPTGKIPQGTIDSYVSLNPLDESNMQNSLNAINTQYWLATGTNFNFIESWLNWKRSGYPALTPVNYPGNTTNATIPRRMIYLSTEILNNTSNYKEAVSRLDGGDILTARVWWDK